MGRRKLKGIFNEDISAQEEFDAFFIHPFEAIGEGACDTIDTVSGATAKVVGGTAVAGYAAGQYAGQKAEDAYTSVHDWAESQRDWNFSDPEKVF